MDLKVSAEGPLMEVYQVLSSCSPGKVEEDQYILPQGESDPPTAYLSTNEGPLRHPVAGPPSTDGITQGEVLNIPYYYGEGRRQPGDPGWSSTGRPTG